MLRRGWVLALALGAPLAAQADDVMLVLDESGSMWAQLGGKAKIEIARQVVGDLVRDWPATHRLGLVAYGHRSKGDCADIETVIPVGVLDAAAYKGKVDQLMPKGMTPISASVMHAADALKSSEQKATVILVSDGEETCNLDPCTVGKQLEAKGVDFTAHVIGFDVPNPAHQAQLRCLAENTGGRFFNARDARELGNALSVLATVSTAPELPDATATLSAPDSAPIATPIEVTWTGPQDAGDYVAIARPDQPPAEQLRYESGLVAGKPLTLTMPSEPGAYELRYVSPRRKSPLLGKRAISATDLGATLEAADVVGAASTVKVTARGPVAPGHWIGFAPKGSGVEVYLDWRRPSGPTSELELRAPSEPGDYELRYVLDERERIIATRPVRVVAAVAAIREAPAEVGAGDRVTVVASGPVGDNHWIGFAPKGSGAWVYLDWKRPNGETSTVELQAPVEPGEYEIRYVLNERDTIVAARSITVAAAKATLQAPDDAAAGATITVTATGPMGGGHWIGFAPKGSPASAYLDYARPTGTTSVVELTAPEQPGDYEIRYILNENQLIAAARPIRIKPK